MKKTVIASSVAALMVAGGACAQSANITLYGRLNLDVEVVRGAQAPATPGGAQANTWATRLTSNVSRLGVRGVEALGNGLDAIFQIEQNVSGDTGNTSSSGFASRETFVGLQGSWGTFKMGHFLMPYDDVHPLFGNTPQLTTTILGVNNIWAQGGINQFNGGFDNRPGNSIRYDAPVLRGFSLSAQVALRDSSGFSDNIGPSANPALGTFGGDNGDHAAELRHAYVLGLGAIYNNGPLQAGLVYGLNKKVRNYAVTGGDQFYADDWAMTGVVAYNFGTFRPAAAYEHLSYDTPTGSLKRDYFGISNISPLGPGLLYIYYGKAFDGKGSAVNGTRVGSLTKGSDTGSQQFTISYSYPLSKRTAVYAGYVKIDNDRNATYNFNTGPYPINTTCTISQPTCGENGKPEGFVVGMYHLF